MNSNISIQAIACSAVLAMATAFSPHAFAQRAPYIGAAATPTPAVAAPPGNHSLVYASGSAPNYPGSTRFDARSAQAPILGALPFASGAIAWIEQKVVSDDLADADLFGFRTLIAGDTAFVSAPAPLRRPGAVYVFQRIGDSWTQTQKISAMPPDGTPPNWSDFFGWSLALSGDRLLVGAPEVFGPMTGPTGGAYIFTRSKDGTWTQSQLLSSPLPTTLSWFGRAGAFAGNTIVIGEPGYNMNAKGNQGAAHVFNELDGVWTETQLIQASDGEIFDGHQFGGAVAADADTVLIGAPGPDWTAGDFPRGAAYVFSNAGGALSELQKLTPGDGEPGDQFGYAVTLYGARALVGAPAADLGATIHQGAAYVFDRAGDAFAETHKLSAEDGEAYDQFGQSVALHGDTAVVGMWSNNDGPDGGTPPPKAGQVHVFSASSRGWTDQPLAASEGSVGNSFGWDVAFDGATVLVGADADGDAFAGAGYFYTKDTVFQGDFDGAP